MAYGYRRRFNTGYKRNYRYGNYPKRYGYSTGRKRAYTSMLRRTNSSIVPYLSPKWRPYNSSRSTLTPKKGNPYGIEYKALPFIQASYTITGGAYYVKPMNIIEQGTGLAQRDGIKITNKSLVLRMIMNNVRVLSDSTPDIYAPHLIRIIVFWDKQPLNVLAADPTTWPKLTDVLAIPAVAVIGMKDELWPLNITNADRFKIIRDWQFFITGTVGITNTVIGAVTTFYGGPGLKSKFIKCFINLNNVETVFADGTPDAPLRSNALYIMVIPDGTSAGVVTQTNVLNMQLNARLRFCE